MSAFFSPKRFLGFVFIFSILFGLQSFTFVNSSPAEGPGDLIIVVEQFDYNADELDGMVGIFGNPVHKGAWVKIAAVETVNSMSIFTRSGEIIYEGVIKAEQFMFKPEGFEAGVYYLQFNIGGKMITKRLLILE